MRTLELHLSDDVYQRLEAIATEQQASVQAVATQTLLASLDDALEDDSDADILAGIRLGLEQALRGETLPAKETLAMLRRGEFNEAVTS